DTRTSDVEATVSDAHRSVAPSSPDESATRRVAPVASLHRLQLAACLALALASPVAVASTIVVANCSDSGAGSLRSAFTQAVSGDTIDVGHLPCSTITLTTGAVSTTVKDLTVEGTAALPALPTINGHYHSAVLLHTGSGTLTVRDVTISGGLKYSSG